MALVKRVVVPEILDELNAQDDRAVRSRRDLRMVNGFMRGESWIAGELKKMEGVKRVVDLGAGDGCLAAEIVRQMPDMEVICVDLVPRPVALDDRIGWWQGDLFDYHDYDETTVVVANLFLHHFNSAELKRLGRLICGVQALLVAEPYRAKLGMVMGRCLFPWVNDVTRHDMLVSIRAGFVEDELGEILGCDFSWSEQRGLFGGIRVKGIRR